MRHEREEGRFPIPLAEGALLNAADEPAEVDLFSGPRRQRRRRMECSLGIFSRLTDEDRLADGVVDWSVQSCRGIGGLAALTLRAGSGARRNRAGITNSQNRDVSMRAISRYASRRFRRTGGQTAGRGSGRKYGKRGDWGIQRKSMRCPLGASLAMLRLPEDTLDRCVAGS